MDILIDGYSLLSTDKLSELEKALDQWIKDNPNKVIFGYEWDKIRYEEDWVKFLGEMIGTDARVNLLTKSNIKLKQDLKESLESYCLQLNNHLPKVIEKLYGVNPEKEEAQLAQLFEGISFLISGAQHLNLNINLEERNEAVQELYSTYEQKDYIEFADLLKYEWLSWIDAYLSQVRNLYLEM